MTLLAIILAALVVLLFVGLGLEATQHEDTKQRADELEAERDDASAQVATLEGQLRTMVLDHRELLDHVRAGCDREDELMTIVRHLGKAVEHAVNGDNDACQAMLSECVYGSRIP